MIKNIIKKKCFFKEKTLLVINDEHIRLNLLSTTHLFCFHHVGEELKIPQRDLEIILVA